MLGFLVNVKQSSYEKSDFPPLEGKRLQYVFVGGKLRIFLWAKDTVRSLKHGCGREMFLMKRIPRDGRNRPNCFLLRIC